MVVDITLTMMAKRYRIRAGIFVDKVFKVYLVAGGIIRSWDYSTGSSVYVQNMLDSTEILLEKEPSGSWGSWTTLPGKLPHKMFLFTVTSIKNHLIAAGKNKG